MSTQPEPEDSTIRSDDDVAESQTEEKKGSKRPQMGLLQKIMNPSVIFSKVSDNIYIVEGNLLLKKEKFEEATDAFKAALEEDNHCVDGYVGIARSLNGMGGVSNAKKSIDYFNKALRLDATRLDIYNDTIDVYDRLGDKKNVAAERKKQFIAKALKADPKDSKANNNMGVIQLQQKNIEAAVSSFKKAIAHNKKFYTAKMNLANAYLQKSKSQKDEADKKHFLKQALALINQVVANKNSAEANLLKAKVHLEDNQLNEATKACNMALKLDPSMKEAFNTKRVIEEKLGNVSSASQAFDSYQSLNRQESKQAEKKPVSPVD